MLFRGLFLLIMFIIATSVKSLKVNSSKEVSYQHANHPPSTDYYNPIPVAVVYEDISSYSRKSHTNTSDSNGSVILNVTSEENVQMTPKRKENVNVAEENVDNKPKLKLVPKPRVLKDIQIPVAVIYENDPNSTQNNYKTDAGTLKRPASDTRKQQSKNNVDIKIKKITTRESKVETENPERKETRTFRKRIGGHRPVIPIIESENYVFSHSGNFHYRYEGGDGTIAYSEGKLKRLDDEAGEAVVGGYSYTDKDGNDFSLSYTADENGYRPVGAHLPTPPPIPPAIARALEYLATATPEPVTKRPVKPESLLR